MFNFGLFLYVVLFVGAIFLIGATISEFSKKASDDSTGDSGLRKSDLRSSVDSEFKLEADKPESTPIDPAIVDDVTEEKPVKTKKKKPATKKPASKNKAASKKRK